MTLDELRRNIKTIIDGEALSCKAFFVLKNKENDTISINIKLLNTEMEKTVGELKLLFKEGIESKLLNMEELELKNISNGDDRKNVIYYYDFDEYPELIDPFMSIDINSYREEYYENSCENIEGIVIYLGTADNGIFLFKKFYPILTLTNLRDYKIFTYESDQFKIAKSNNYFRLDGKFDFIRIDNKLFVLNKNVLEKNFGFDNILKKDASDCITKLHELNIIESEDIFNDVLENDMSMVRKLSSAKRTSPVIYKSISKEQIATFIKQNEKLKEKFKFKEDGVTLKMTSKKAKKEFIKLLNDDFLFSKLTKENYDVKAKDKM